MTREELILEMLPYALSTAVWFSLHHARLVDLPDLKAEAAWMTIKAVDRYDPNRGMSMKSWVRKRVRGALQDYHRREDIRGRYHKDGSSPWVPLQHSMIVLAPRKRHEGKGGRPRKKETV